MSAQRHIFDPGPALANMTDREEAAYQHLQTRPTGVTSTELGQHVHQTIGYPCACSPFTICPWAMSQGETVGRQLRKRGVAFKRAHTHWTLTVAARPHETGTFPPDF